jgi:hypothetical protein
MQIKDIILFTLSSATLAAAVFLVLRYLRLRQRQMVHLERLAAIDKGLLTPTSGGDDMSDTARDIGARTDSMTWFRVTTMGLGFLFLFGGMGIVSGLLIVEDEGLRTLWSLGLIPLMAGFGLMAFSFLSRWLER